MARHPRFDFPGITRHIVQRGVDRQACFRCRDDYLFFRDALGQATDRHGVALHAYALMGNHVHLLVTPGEAGATSRMMQALGRRYVARFNLRHGRTGTLWEGRFKAALVESRAYVLACHRYIELNPLRAGIVTAPGEYEWTSFHHNALGRDELRLQAHPEYLALGADPALRRKAYLGLFADAMGPAELEALRLHTRQQRLLASDAFHALMGPLLKPASTPRPRGRPRKTGCAE